MTGAGVVFVPTVYNFMTGSESALKLGEYESGAVQVYTVRLGDGCREACIQCGAYDTNGDRADFIAKGVTRERIEVVLGREFVYAPAGVDKTEVVDAEIGDNRKRVADILANYVTTDVNQEPLNDNGFLNFAELVKEMSEGRSRAVCISHGLRVKKQMIDDGMVIEPCDEEAAERLDKIAAMMDDKDLFVLSLDLARSGGKIKKDLSLWSYAETLNRLLPALRNGARITVSIQGNEERESRQYRVVAENLYGQIKSALMAAYGWNNQDVLNLHMDTGRAWVGQGRAAALPGIGPDGVCPVIPDTEFVSHTLSSRATNMAFVDAVSGKVFVRPNNPKRSYNDVVKLGRRLSGRGGKSSSRKDEWVEVVLEGEVEDLSAQFSRDAKMAAFVQTRLERRAAVAARDKA